MIRREHRAEWVALVLIVLALSTLYRFDLREMVKRILEWGFALIGFKLLFDYGIIKGLDLVLNKGENGR